VARLPDAMDDGEVAGRIRSRRGGELTPLDRMLLHSPPVADGWNALLGAIRTQSTLPADIRELVILRIAVLNGAEYEWQAHEPHGRAAGLTDDDLAAARGPASVDGLCAARAAVLAFTDALTREVDVPGPVFAAVQAHFDTRELVELTATVAAYNMVSRFLVGLDVQP